MKLHRMINATLIFRRVAKVEAAMTTKTSAHQIAEEQNRATLRRIGNRVLVTGVVVAVIGRAGRDDAPFESSQRLRYIRDGERVLRLRKTFREKRAIDRIGMETAQDRLLLAKHPKFHGQLRKHGDERLLFERVQVGIAPRQNGAISYVHQAHRAT